MATTYTITVQATVDGNKYFVDGVQQDSLTIEAGQSYIFDQSDASNAGHPLALSRTDNGTHGGGVSYTNGVVVTGTAGTDRVLTFTAPNNAPATLYYYCQVHSGMGGSITVQNQIDNDPIRNFFKTLIVGEYSTTDTQLDVISTDAPSLPDPAVSGAYNLTIFSGTDSATSERFEIVRVTAKSNDTLTVVRAQEGTTALDMQDPNHVFGVVYSATKKTFDDIKAEIDQAQLDIAQNATDISNIEFADQDLNTTDDVTFNSVTTTSRFQLPSFANFPSNPSVGEIFINSLTNELVVYNGLNFQRIVGDIVAQTSVANATAGIFQTFTDQSIELISPNATAFSLDINAIALNQVERALEFANSSAKALDAIAQFKPVDVQFFIQAGGGGGGSSRDESDSGGGGGGGGLISSVIGERSGEDSDPVATFSAVPFTNYSVVIGAGGNGARGNAGSNAGFGGDSSIFGLTAIGGGRGAVHGRHNAGNGGCGGGASDTTQTYRGQGTTNQGFSGGGGSRRPNAGGGGGGTGSVANSGTQVPGSGTTSSITGTAIARGGGGYGGDNDSESASGIDGGGGIRVGFSGTKGLPGEAHKGGGGGAGGDDSTINPGGNGGSGTVILLYPDTASLTLSNGATSLNGENIDRGDGFRYTEIITTGTVTF